MTAAPSETTIAVIGLGYVGWPLAMALAQHGRVIAHDANPERIARLQNESQSSPSNRLELTADPAALKPAGIYIIAVPTPVDRHQHPDLEQLDNALDRVAEQLDRGDLVIIESTLYPGATQTHCMPRLQDGSGLLGGQEFAMAYCPERLNPGDPAHQLADVVKVVSASDPESLARVTKLYEQIIPAGVHPVQSIRVAEAAKVIENTQRDLNIALINELSVLFNRLDIDTEAVLDAAASKWNFHRFEPGLVGGHCIGIDPYYLTHVAREVGHPPELILAGRQINESMSRRVAQRTVKRMSAKGIEVTQSRILIMGVTYKKNHPDARYSQVFEVIRELQDFGAQVDIHDPVADPDTLPESPAVVRVDEPQSQSYDAIVIAVAHDAFMSMGADAIHALGRPMHVLFDVQWCLPPDQSDERL